MSKENGKRSISGHVARTAAEAQTCKKSSLHLSHPSIAWGTGRQTPLLNRFYHARSKIVQRMVSYSIDALAISKKHAVQILMLGAGLDTSLETSCCENTNVATIFAVDLPEVIEARQRSTAAVNNKAVMLVSADLRDVSSLWERLHDQGFDRSIPTVILLECVLCYIDTSHVLSLLTSLSESLHGGAIMVTYDPIVPLNHHPTPDIHNVSTVNRSDNNMIAPNGYAHMLYAKFSERGAPLLHCLDSIEMCQHFIQSSCHWPHVTCHNIYDALRCFFTAAERGIPCTAEPFDEFNALALLNRMYGVTLASNDGPSFHRTWTQLVSRKPCSTVQTASEVCGSTQKSAAADSNLLYRLSAAERRLLAVEMNLSSPLLMEGSKKSCVSAAVGGSTNAAATTMFLPTSIDCQYKYTIRPVKLLDDNITAVDTGSAASTECLISQLTPLVRVCFHDVMECVPSVRKYMNRCLKALGSLQSLGKEYALARQETPGQFWVIEAEVVDEDVDKERAKNDGSTAPEEAGFSRKGGVVLVGCVGLKRGGGDVDTHSGDGTRTTGCVSDDSGGGGVASGGDCCEISHLCVHPSHRRQGLARSLLTKVLSHIDTDHHHIHDQQQHSQQQQQQQQQQQHDNDHVSSSLSPHASIIHLTVLSDLQSSAWELYTSMGFINTGTPVALEMNSPGGKNKGGKDKRVCHMQHMTLQPTSSQGIPQSPQTTKVLDK